jgi:hypothetical protein
VNTIPPYWCTQIANLLQLYVNGYMFGKLLDA